LPLFFFPEEESFALPFGEPLDRTVADLGERPCDPRLIFPAAPLFDDLPRFTITKGERLPLEREGMTFA
jgi:hypothetical protein